MDRLASRPPPARDVPLLSHYRGADALHHQEEDMTDDIVNLAVEPLKGVTLHLDHDGYFCARGPSYWCAVLVAYPVRDDSGEIWQPYVCNAMIERFNAHPDMAAEITALRAEVERLTGAIAEKGGTEYYPTLDAYLRACEALTRHKDRVEAAEAELAAARAALVEAAEAAKLAKWCEGAFAEKLTPAETYQLRRIWEYADAAVRLAALTTKGDTDERA
jgi:hypothetical protein